MPIEIPNNNLYRIRELAVMPSGGDYILNMNPGKARACVICISRSGNIGAGDLKLSEDDLNNLYTGGKLEYETYTLQGITGHQLAALSQYHGLHIRPPVYVRAWSMAPGQSGTVLYIPEEPDEQVFLVPVHYQTIRTGNQLTVRLEEVDGYADGDLLYQREEHPPVPIPGSWLNRPIVLRRPADQYKVIAAPAVAQNYIQK